MPVIMKAPINLAGGKNLNKDFIKKTLAYLIPFFILAAFLFLLSSSSYLKENLEENRKIPVVLKELDTLVAAHSWKEAESKVEILTFLWEKSAPKLQISSEEDDMKNFSLGLQRLKGFLRGKDDSSALAEIGILKLTWEQLGK